MKTNGNKAASKKITDMPGMATTRLCYGKGSRRPKQMIYMK